MSNRNWPRFMVVILLLVAGWADTSGRCEAEQPTRASIFPPSYGLDQLDALRFGTPTPLYQPHGLWVLDDYEFRSQPGIQQAMLLTPEELGEMVPRQSGIQFAGCPNCDGGAQENKVLRWRPGLGNRVECQYCKMVFPNERFPNNASIDIKTPRGETQVYRWHRNAAGREFYFEGRAFFDQIFWCQNMANRLANLYALTGNRECARRAAAIIGRFAQRYPDYAFKFDQPFRPKKFYPANQKHPYDDYNTWNMGRTYHYAYCDIPDVLALAYDLIAPSGVFEELKDLLGADIDTRIREDLFRLSYDYTACRPDVYSNMSPTMYHDMIVVGRVLNDPNMVHEALNRLQTLMGKNFYADGWWFEAAPSYHTQVVKSLDDIARMAGGYSDPADFKPAQGLRLEHADVAKLIPVLAAAQRARAESVLPDGREVPVNDTWSDWYVKPLEKSDSRLWSAMGHAVLGAGEGADQFQAHLHWAGNHGHMHLDKGSLIVFAQGREAHSDIGYTHTRWRNWSINTASHNTVVIDERSQKEGSPAKSARGNLLWYDTDGAHVSVADLDASPAYPECKTYRRRLVHVHAGPGRDYLVDRFDVEGGTIHDWFLHGDANLQGELKTSLTLDRAVPTLMPAWGRQGEYKGETDTDTRGDMFHPYGMIRKIRAGKLDAVSTSPVTFMWNYPNAGMRTHIAPGAAQEVFAFEAPAIRGAERNDPKLDQFWRNGIMLRNTGRASHFMVVHEAFGTAPWLKTVEFEGERVRITHEGGADNITLGEAGISVESTAGYSYRMSPPLSGFVSNLATDAGKTCVTLDQKLPQTRALRLTYGNGRSDTFQVERVEGNRVWLDGDMGLSYDTAKAVAEWKYFPQSKVSGEVRFTTFVPDTGNIK